MTFKKPDMIPNRNGDVYAPSSVMKAISEGMKHFKHVNVVSKVGIGFGNLKDIKSISMSSKVKRPQERLANNQFTPSFRIKKMPGAVEIPFWAVLDESGEELFHIVRTGTSAISKKERLFLAALRAMDKVLYFFRDTSWSVIYNDHERESDLDFEAAAHQLHEETRLQCRYCDSMGILVKDPNRVDEFSDPLPTDPERPVTESAPHWVAVYVCDRCTMFDDPIRGAQHHYTNIQIDGDSVWANATSRRDASREYEQFITELDELTAPDPNKINQDFVQLIEKGAVHKTKGSTSEGEKAIRGFLGQKQSFTEMIFPKKPIAGKALKKYGVDKALHDLDTRSAGIPENIEDL